MHDDVHLLRHFSVLKFTGTRRFLKAEGFWEFKSINQTRGAFISHLFRDYDLITYRIYCR